VYSVKEKTEKTQNQISKIAKTIQHIIRQECASTYYAPPEKNGEKGGPKPVMYSNIAVLSRKKSGQIAKTVAALAAAGIPVTSAAAVNICEYTEVKMLMDILSLLDNAQQDIPLCSALLSPIGKLTADDVAQIRLTYKDEQFFRVACQKYAEEQSDTIAKKLKAFYNYFHTLRNKARVLDVGALLVEIISDKHTRLEASFLLQSNGEACLKRIHRFIEEASVEPQSVHAFLNRLRDLDYKIEYNENGGDDSVKVITMHSSKGLEYPIVIVDDLSANFKGDDGDNVYVEEKYALAPRSHNEGRMTRSDTLLRRLHKQKEALESIADELNLYYVALTRAKYGLHLIFTDIPPMPNVRYARSFAELTDFDVWQKYFVHDKIFDIKKEPKGAPFVFNPDGKLVKEIKDTFDWKYSFAGYENLPVKSSATALLDSVERRTETDGSEVAEEKPEANTDKESGIAYHAFLERFDFALIQEKETLKEQVELLRTAMVQENAEGAELLDTDKLLEILQNPVFTRLQDKRLFKEQQFLASLPVKDTYALKKDALPDLKMREDGEEMIFQGAIDLLAVGIDEAEIIDYKYSRKNAKSLKEHYQPQLDLYRQATAKILKLPLEKVHGTIVNIYYGFEVKMD
jgi:ATP-dependent exoDNAse (exonuclease V) beta subunit